MTIRVLIVDDHPLVRSGLVAVLQEAPDIEVVAECSDGAEGVACHAEHRPDVTLMDLRMPRLGGVEAIRAIVAACPGARIVALTTYDGDADIYRALDAGACAYLLKNVVGRDVTEAVRGAAAGRRMIPPVVAERLALHTPRADLTAREIEVLGFAARGLRNKEIAGAIGRAEDTVKVHLRHIMSKLGVSDRTRAVTFALERGIIHLWD
jgi:two-component system, NarL family, response regulator